MGRVNPDGKVAVIGPAAIDIIFNGPDRWPRDGETVSAKSYAVRAGGTALNSASWLAALKGIHSIELYSRIGEDLTGNLVVSSLREPDARDSQKFRVRLHDTHLLKVKGQNTRVIFIRSIPSRDVDEDSESQVFQLGREGDRSMIGVGGAADGIDASDLRRAASWPLNAKDILFISGLGTLPGFAAPEVTEQLLNLRGKGVVIAADLLLTDMGEYGSVRTANEHVDPAVGEVLKCVDWIMCNEPESEILSGIAENWVAAAEHIAGQFGPSLVAIKLQERGSYVFAPGDHAAEMRLGNRGELVPALPQQVLDATGAGDAWCAGFIRGMLHSGGTDARFAAMMANKIASECISRLGAAAIPDGLNWIQLVHDTKHSR